MRSLALTLCCLWSWVLTPAVAGAAEEVLLDTPAAESLEGVAVIAFTLPEGSRLAAWQLAHKLAYAAQGARFVKRIYWWPLAEAFDSVGLTPPGKVAVRQVGRFRVLIAKNTAPAGVSVTLYLPEGLLQPLEGKVRLDLATSYTGTRSTTQEVVVWPTKVVLGYSNEVSENRTVEWNLAYNHSRILNRNRSGLRDDEGHVIRFRDLPQTKVQDTREALLEGSTYFNLAHGTRLGRVDLGITGGAEWAQDRLNFLDRRTSPYLGGTARFSSERVDGRRLEVGLRLGANLEKFTIVEPLFDDAGNPVGTTATVEENRLATWELTSAWAVPLYQFEHVTLVTLDGQARWAQSFERTGATGTIPDSRERIARAEAGVTLQTPMGAAVRLGGKLTWSRLPGLAGKKIEDVQVSYGFAAEFKLRF